MADSTNFTVVLPNELRRRATAMAKRFGTTLNQMMRDALFERVEFLEAKVRAEEEQRRRDRESRTDHKLPTLEERRAARASAKKSVGTTSTVRMPNTDGDDAYTSPTRAEDVVDVHAPLEVIYQQEARKIFEVLDSPAERRLRTIEAIEAIKRAHPLTHPADGQMLLHLEQLVTELRARNPRRISLLRGATEESIERRFTDQLAGAAKRIADELTGKEIDPSNIQSHGDVNSDDTEE